MIERRMPAFFRLLGGLGAAAVLAALAGCAADREHREGLQLIAAGDREHGIALLRHASQSEPTNADFRIDLLKQQSYAIRDLLARAADARRNGQRDQARAAYDAILRIDPNNERGTSGIAQLEQDARQDRAIAEALALARQDPESARARLQAVLADSPGNVAARRALQDVEEQAQKVETQRKAQIAAASVMKKPVTLQFRDANLRMVFEALARTTNLNVIFDRDIRPDLKTTIFVKDASVEDTVDMILLQNQLERKTLNANTLFIYPATAGKQKEYQDLQVRTFQISNADAKYLQNVLKTVLKVKDVALDERTNTLVVRDTPDAIAVAEKVIAAHDIADPEVMLEVEVLEVTRSRVSDLGIQWPDTVTATVPNNAAGGLTVGDLHNITAKSLGISGLSATINAKLQDSDANLLASPRIRTRSREKAKILIGDRVPTIVKTVTPTTSGAAVVTGSATYQDVGIKLEVEPQVYLEGDVGIKINLEVSNITNTITGSDGSVYYQIGTRNTSTSLRLRDGETQIMGGLISDQDRASANKVPGLGQLPIAGRLFSDHSDNNQKSEIILSITPHILRGQAVADSALRDVFSGSESSIRATPLRLDPVGSIQGSASVALPGGMVGGGSTLPGGMVGGGSTLSGGTAGSGAAAPAGAAPLPPPATLVLPATPAAAADGAAAAAAAATTGDPVNPNGDPTRRNVQNPGQMPDIVWQRLQRHGVGVAPPAPPQPEAEPAPAAAPAN